MAGTVLCKIPWVDFAAGAIQNAFFEKYRTHKMLCFSIETVAPKLASQVLRNDVCETVSGHVRFILGSCSESSLHCG